MFMRDSCTTFTKYRRLNAAACLIHSCKGLEKLCQFLITLIIKFWL